MQFERSHKFACMRVTEYSKACKIININEFYDMEIKLNKSSKANINKM